MIPESLEHTDSDPGACSCPVSEIPASTVPQSETPGSAAPRSLAGTGWRLAGILRTVRPHQWVKNVFVLAPVVFAKEIFDPQLMKRSIGAFFVFCLLAGAVYTINDVADVESDRRHPVKRSRPIASGKVPVPLARLMAVALVLLALGGAATGTTGFLVAATGYLVLNLAYSFRLKHIAYVDVGCIAAGFVLRVTAGGYAAHIVVSHYLLACTALLALFLGFGKRRHEIAAGMKKAGKQRAALENYSVKGLDWSLWLTAIATVICYTAYTLDPATRAFFSSDWLWPSAGLVALAVLRFMHLVRSRPDAESPTQEMLSDPPFLLIIAAWVGLVMWVVYHITVMR